jgi:hypothetical protein
MPNIGDSGFLLSQHGRVAGHVDLARDKKIEKNGKAAYRGRRGPYQAMFSKTCVDQSSHGFLSFR